jgi:hypothetical protein
MSHYLITLSTLITFDRVNNHILPLSLITIITRLSECNTINSLDVHVGIMVQCSRVMHNLILTLRCLSVIVKRSVSERYEPVK